MSGFQGVCSTGVAWGTHDHKRNLRPFQRYGNGFHASEDVVETGFSRHKTPQNALNRALLGSRVRVTLEISADTDEDIPENVVRMATENYNTLRFEEHGFEEE